jgi:hypothetical protein
MPSDTPTLCEKNEELENKGKVENESDLISNLNITT